MIHQIKDWARPILQTILLIAIAILAVLFDFAEVLASIITKVGLENSDIHICIRAALAYGRWPLSIVVFVVVLHLIRCWNKEIVLNSDNELYHIHTYAGYWFSSNILGFKRCRLKNVPIPMQIKLVSKGMFERFIIDEGIHKAPDNDKVKLIITNDRPFSQTVNYVISDTYKVSLSQLPRDVRDFTTIEIDRSSPDDHMRYDSEELVKAVITSIRNLPPTVVRINAFMTTNPTNTYRIAKEAFVTVGRDSIKHLYVFPQDRVESQSFKEKALRVF